MATSPSGADLLTDLIYLCKREGACAARLAKAGTVNLVLGAEDDEADMKLERLRSAVNSLDGDQSQVLLTAFGLSPATEGMKSLSARRKIYGQQVGRKVDTIAAREKVALEELRVKLLTGWYPASPLPRRVTELHNGVINELVELTTVVSDRCWVESRHCYRMLALFDEADYYEIATSYPMTVTTYGGWTSTTGKVANGYTVRFYPPETLRRGQVYDLRFKFSPLPGDPDDLALPGQICEESLAFHERTLEARFEVVFLGETPRVLYHFSGLTGVERPGEATSDRKINPAERSVTGVRFRDLYGGLYAGLTWEWAARRNVVPATSTSASEGLLVAEITSSGSPPPTTGSGLLT